MVTKPCRRCNHEKPLTLEHWNSLRGWVCKDCHRARLRAFRKSDKRKQWEAENVDRVKEYERRRREKDREKRNALSAAHYKANVERSREVRKLWRDANRERIADQRRQRRQSDPEHKLSHNLKAAFRKALKGSRPSARFHEKFGYTVAELMRHLERQFDRHMTWDNHGTYWEIDHIVPVASFTLPDEFQACWALPNLRPLKKEINRAKSAKRLLLL